MLCSTPSNGMECHTVFDDVVQKAFDQIQEKRLKTWKGEEEVRYIWIKALEDATQLHLHAERDRKDASYNHVIIEFKAPGLFQGKKTSSKFIEATERRIFPYIQKEALKTGIPEEDFIGIAIDGEHICFTQVTNGQLHAQHLIPFSPYAVRMVIDAIRSDTRRELTTENLLNDFGHGSLNARNLMQSLADGLSNQLNKPQRNKIKMLFEEWRTLYGQVADMSILQASTISQEIKFNWAGQKEDSLPARLFIIHTYNSLLIKLLAAEIVSSYGLTTIKQPAQNMSALQDDQHLISSLDNDIEHSGIFTQAGIKSFVEEVIFSWYLEIAKDEKNSNSFLQYLRNLLSVLSLYRTDKISKARDVLRDLYQGLVPSKLRQSLGEFYTPDWLVDFTLSKAKSETWLGKKVLDPTCGSGAFLISIIRQKRAEGEAHGWKSKQIIDHICESVWGFDLNPLAVQTARVNFLMEIADLLAKNQGIEIEIPILLADAIYSPAQNPKDKEQIVQYKIGSQVAKLDILLPTDLALNRARLDHVFELMSDSIENNLDFNSNQKKLIDANILSELESKAWEKPLAYTYNQVLNLHKQQWNGIWFKVVRNFFWSATAGTFDYIVGNPPWVRWSKLPEAYRERVKPTCENYGIFSKTKRHGGNELDISAMIIYTTSDKWLKDNGCLAFVVTGTLFKNPSSAGFRTFKLQPANPNSFYLNPISIDDLRKLKPFEDASNHTVVSIFKKSHTESTYPVPYRLWNNKQGNSKSIPSSLSIHTVLERLVVEDKEAFPVSELGSPWAILNPSRFGSIKYLSDECKWTKGRKGITADINGIYFVPILQNNGQLLEIRSRPEAGRTDIGAIRTQWVEPDLLYPLIKGASDFETCYLKLTAPDYNHERLYTFLPNIGISQSAYQACENQLNSPQLKKTKDWFKTFEQQLRDRSTYRRQMKGAPYQAVYNVGEYTFKPWKVIWPEMSSSFYAAVAGSDTMPINGTRVFIPDHKVYFSSFDDKETAYYLCGLLNSETVREWLNSHNVSIQVADIFKHLSVPEFDNTNQLHLQLANLVETAHYTHNKIERNVIIQSIQSLSEIILSDWSLTLS